jgi:hypothetical protein
VDIANQGLQCTETKGPCGAREDAQCNWAASHSEVWALWLMGSGPEERKAAMLRALSSPARPLLGPCLSASLSPPTQLHIERVLLRGCGGPGRVQGQQTWSAGLTSSKWDLHQGSGCGSNRLAVATSTAPKATRRRPSRAMPLPAGGAADPRCGVLPRLHRGAYLPMPPCPKPRRDVT